MILKNLYDSHIHLLMTGETLTQVDLSKVKNKSDLQVACSKADPDPRGWVLGFGWDENHFEVHFALDRILLDQLFPEQDVFFVRTDGHTSCVNSKVLSRLGIEMNKNFHGGSLQEFIGRDSSGVPNGILKESAHMKVYEILPPPRKPQIKASLRRALELFHREGFTHLRDMTTRWAQWEASLEMVDDQDFKSHVEHNFSCEDIHDLDRALQEIRQARQTENKFMKARGVKFFYDGSLGSRTAALSRAYADEATNSGQTLWSQQETKEVLRRAWAENFDVSVHVIGDRAVHEVIQCAREVSASGIVGKLNLEHVQILKPETLKLMKPLHLTCHMQPCHWLSDRFWLKSRLGNLYEYVFPWEALRKAGFDFRFGSDSPIEKPSLSRNLRALKESAKADLRALGDDPLRYHIFSSKDGTPGETHLLPDEEGFFKVEKVIFDGEVVYEGRF